MVLRLKTTGYTTEFAVDGGVYGDSGGGPNEYLGRRRKLLGFFRLASKQKQIDY